MRPYFAAALLFLALAVSAAAQDAPPPAAVQDAPPPSEPEEELGLLPPIIASYPSPAFPDAAFEAGVEGTAVVRLDIDPEGTVTSAVLVRDPGHGMGPAALEAIRQAVFEPATRGGVPVPFADLYFKVPLDHDDIEPPPIPEGEMAQQLTRTPELVSAPEAPYPSRMLEEGIEATVGLRILIDAWGAVTRVELVRSGGRDFDVAALDAVWQFRFSPGYAGEVPVPVAIDYDYVFELTEQVVETVVETGYDDIDPEGPENLVGIVRERGTRDPMPHVEVHVEEFDHSLFTDDHGRFAFRGLPVGTWHVLVLAPGFEPYRTEEDILQGERTDVVYFVRPSPTGVNRTVVRTKKERKEVSRTALTIEEIERVAGTFGDPVKVVQNLPGVARSPFDFGILIVRGSGPEDTGEYVDGLRVPMLYHFGGFRSVLSPIMIDSIDFYPGAYGVRWGRTQGGVMNLTTRKQWPDHVHGLVRIDLIDSEAALIGPVKRKGEKVGGFGIAGRRSYLDLVLPMLAPPSVDLSNTVLPQWWDIQAKFALQPSRKVDLWWFVYASDDKTSTVSDEPVAEGFADTAGTSGFRTSFFRATLGGALRPHDTFDLDWRFGYSYDAIRMSLGSAFGGGTSSHFLYGRLEGSWSPTKWFRTTAGLDYAGGHDDFELYTTAVEQTLDANPTAESESLVIVGDITGHAPALFLEGEFTPWGDDRLKIVPGLRFDYYWLNHDTSFSTVDPRLAIRTRVYKTTVLKWAVGLFHQNPQPWEMFEGIGNPDLDPERSHQFVLGIEQQITPFLSLDAQLFYKHMTNMVVMVFDDVAAAEDVWRNGGLGRVLGGEVMLRWTLHRNFFGWIAYTVSRSVRQDTPDSDWYTFEFDQPHILDIVASYEFPYHITLGARFRLVSGNPYTGVMGAMFDVDSPMYIPLYDAYMSGRVPPFHQLDIRIDKQFIFRKWRLTAYLEILNIYNRQNPETVLYNFDYTETDYINSLPFLPNLGLRAEF